MPKFVTKLMTAAALCLALAAGAAAADYPDRPIRLIIPFPPGGSNDVVGRLIAKTLSEKIGQQVFVDNRGGAGGMIGTEALAKAAPDGYTLGIVSIAHAVNPALHDPLPYDPIKSFEPDFDPGDRPERARRQPGPAGQLGEGVDRARQAEAGRTQLRLRRHRQLPASRRRTVQAGGERQHRARALQRRRTRDAGRGRGPRQDHVLVAHSDDAIDQGGTPAAAWRRRHQAQRGAAGRADDRRGRRARLRGQQLVGNRRAGRHAQADRRQTLQGHPAGAAIAGDAQGIRASKARRPSP